MMNTKTMNQPMRTTGNHASVHGLNIYYEIHSAIEMFGEVLPLLAQGRQVIAVDLQAHGRTADNARPLSFELMADDIAALLKHLSL